MRTYTPTCQQVIQWFGRRDDVILATEARLSGPAGFRYVARCRRCRGTLKSQMVGNSPSWNDTDDPSRALRELRTEFLAHLTRAHKRPHVRRI